MHSGRVTRQNVVQAPHNLLRLRDGRRLSYGEFGDPTGAPVLFFHGLGASRLTRHPDDRLTAALGVRLITVDRPGCGLTDPQPGRTLLSWPADVRQLADHLGLAQFSILGWSGGGPHALACAYRLPDRVAAVGLGSGAAPLHWTEAGAACDHYWRVLVRLGQLPWLVRLAMWEQRHESRLGPERFLNNYLRALPPVDRRILAAPEMRRMMLEANAEVYRRWSRGVADDARVLTGPWGFPLQAVQVPVFLWHGDQDNHVPIAFARQLADRLPNCRPRFLPGEAHFLIFPRWAEVLLALTKAQQHQAA